MPEEQAFCVLVKLMFDYGMRDLFKQGFEILHLKFYQLERLIQVSLSFMTGIAHTELTEVNKCHFLTTKGP